MPLVTYAETRPWAGKIAAAVDNENDAAVVSPMRGTESFPNDQSLSAEQDQDDWSVGRTPGRLREMRAMRLAPRAMGIEGWSIPQPDVVGEKCPSRCRFRRAVKWNIRTRFVPTHFARISGCRWWRCGPRVRRMFIMGRVYSPSGFGVAAACPGGRAVHGIDVERSGGAAAGA